MLLEYPSLSFWRKRTILHHTTTQRSRTVVVRAGILGNGSGILYSNELSENSLILGLIIIWIPAYAFSNAFRRFVEPSSKVFQASANHPKSLKTRQTSHFEGISKGFRSFFENFQTVVRKSIGWNPDRNPSIKEFSDYNS